MKKVLLGENVGLDDGAEEFLVRRLVPDMNLGGRGPGDLPGVDPTRDGLFVVDGQAIADFEQVEAMNHHE